MRQKEMDANDVVVGKTGTMPLAAFLAGNEDAIDDAELGARIKESQKRYQEYVEVNRPKWQEEGALFKKVRETMGRAE